MSDSKEPYGPASEAHYADPGYQADKKKRYPLASDREIHAAWSYINMPKNAAKYTPEQVALIKGRIKAAAKRIGMKIEEDDDTRGSDEMFETCIETRSASQVDNVDFAQRVITVIAVPYEQPTKVYFRQEMWNEVFSRTAFLGIEKRDKQSRIPVTAVLQVPNQNHEGGRLVGRVMEADPHNEVGLIAHTKISRTDYGDETLELARDDALSASVGFMVKNPRSDEAIDKHTRTRRINRAFLDHLAFVATPAYKGAKILAMRGPTYQSEVDLPKLDTPFLDEYADDPVFRWASERISGC
jgi:phage head maturation protease